MFGRRTDTTKLGHLATQMTTCLKSLLQGIHLEDQKVPQKHIKTPKPSEHHQRSQEEVSSSLALEREVPAIQTGQLNIVAEYTSD